MKENKMMCDRQKECLACTNRSCMMAGIEDPKLGEECGVFGMYDLDGMAAMLLRPFIMDCFRCSTEDRKAVVSQ